MSMNKLTKGYRDNRTEEEALANTRKGWEEEDRFYQSVIKPLNGQMVGGDKDRTIGNFSSDPDFLVEDLYIEYQTTFKNIRQLSFKRHKILNFNKYSKYIIIQRIQDLYVIVDSTEGFYPVNLFWCGNKPGYQLEDGKFLNLVRLKEEELINAIQERIKRHQKN